MLHLSDPDWHLEDNSSVFVVSIRVGSRRTTLELTGALDLAAGHELHKALSCAVERGAQAVMIDLSGVTFIDAHGIGLIVGAWRSATGRGMTFSVSGVQGQVGQVFALVGLDDLVASNDPAEDADGERSGDADGER